MRNPSKIQRLKPYLPSQKRRQAVAGHRGTKQRPDSGGSYKIEGSRWALGVSRQDPEHYAELPTLEAQQLSVFSFISGYCQGQQPDTPPPTLQNPSTLIRTTRNPQSCNFFTTTQARLCMQRLYQSQRAFDSRPYHCIVLWPFDPPQP